MSSFLKLLIKATLLSLALPDAVAAASNSVPSESSSHHEQQEGLEGTTGNYLDWFLDTNPEEPDRWVRVRVLENDATTQKKSKRKRSSSTKECLEEVMEESIARDFRNANPSSDETKALGIRNLQNEGNQDDSDIDIYLDLIYNTFFGGEDKKRQENDSEETEAQQHRVEEKQLEGSSYDPEKLIDELSNGRRLAFSEDIQRKVRNETLSCVIYSEAFENLISTVINI